MRDRLGGAVAATVVLITVVVSGVVALAAVGFLGFRWIAGQPLAFANPVIMAAYSVALVVGGMGFGLLYSMSGGLVDALGDMAVAWGTAVGVGARKKRADERRTDAETMKLEAEAEGLRPPPVFVGSNGSVKGEWT